MKQQNNLPVGTIILYKNGEKETILSHPTDRTYETKIDLETYTHTHSRVFVHDTLLARPHRLILPFNQYYAACRDSN